MNIRNIFKSPGQLRSDLPQLDVCRCVLLDVAVNTKLMADSRVLQLLEFACESPLLQTTDAFC